MAGLDVKSDTDKSSSKMLGAMNKRNINATLRRNMDDYIDNAANCWRPILFHRNINGTPTKVHLMPLLPYSASIVFASPSLGSCFS